MPRKKKSEDIHPCPRCGSLMGETETGRQCPTCHLTEWVDEGGVYTSGVAKCPNCDNCSPNNLICSFCGYPIDDKTRKLWESKEK